jgi:hypothetical protein
MNDDPRLYKILDDLNINTASIIISYDDFMKFLEWTENSWEFK